MSPAVPQSVPQYYNANAGSPNGVLVCIPFENIEAGMPAALMSFVPVQCYQELSQAYFSQAQSKMGCACMIEWLVCLLTGFFCIFCCHQCLLACFIDQPALQASCDNLNSRYFGGARVMYLGGNQVCFDSSRVIRQGGSQPQQVQAPVIQFIVQQQPVGGPASSGMQGLSSGMGAPATFGGQQGPQYVSAQSSVYYESRV